MHFDIDLNVNVNEDAKEDILRKYQLNTENTEIDCVDTENEFGADSECNSVWMAASAQSVDGHSAALMHCDKLYPFLCKTFIERTGCSRVPQKCDLEPFMLKF